MSTMLYSPDRVYATPLHEVRDFLFDERVAEVFPDMIQRSVPGYQSILSMLGQLSEKFARPHAHYYDLGCSLGAATLAMQRHLHDSEGKIFAIDNSPAMLTRAKQHVSRFCYTTPVEFVLADINESVIENAAIVVLNFTLQFLAPEQRQCLLSRIYQGLLPGGLLFLSEKIVLEPATLNHLMTELYYDFKRQNGYSELEISQKRSALEKVLRPDTLQTHYERIHNAGFSVCQSWFQQLNFCSIIAIKT
ncbi:MAG: carboxy-S-adenosyl-L-methionine synthase CmoA [Legionellaceae bacterium]|nr:carboxy-S-adenosyl-L-methionine synthase CmoA [Legionellaceae bacterium]